MIKVEIKNEGKKFSSLTVKGHAGSGEYGHDLVCAGVSTVLVGSCNALEEVQKFEIIIEEGFASIKDKEEISFHDEVFIETMIKSLLTMEESYGKFIQIKNL